jgi:hemerythrin-like metal-binding protein
MIDVHFPEWLYKALPYVYVGVGLLTIVVLRNEMAVFSGITLMSAAALVWTVRSRARRESRQWDADGRAAEPDGKLAGKAPDSALVRLSWQPSFECGHAVIDAQHRRLFGIGNELINSVLTGKSEFDVEILLEELIDHITDHFCTEEAVLAKTRHPLSKEHQEIHRSLLTKATSLRDRYHAGEVIVRDLVGFIAYDVVTEHIIKEDLKFAAAAN